MSFKGEKKKLFDHQTYLSIQKHVRDHCFMFLFADAHSTRRVSTEVVFSKGLVKEEIPKFANESQRVL